jgi:hypothetical protein
MSDLKIYPRYNTPISSLYICKQGTGLVIVDIIYIEKAQ